MKPVLIYTLERTGTNFISYCFHHVFKEAINTHNKNKAFTTGEDINYKDYKVFVTVRDPKNVLFSSLLVMISELDEDAPLDRLSLDTKDLIDRQIFYFNDILSNEDFYILSFEDFTKNTKNVFLKMASDNKFSEIQQTKIKDNPFFDDPLSEILNNPLSDKKRYPRNKSNRGSKDIENVLQLEEIQSHLSVSQELYQRVMNRYKNQ